MHSMTLDQLRAAAAAGGLAGVTLKGQGGSFFIDIATRSGTSARLAKARTTQPRLFGTPAAALTVLRGIGIVSAHIDIADWTPGQKDMTRSRRNRAEAMRSAHLAAAYNQWLATEIQAALADPQPSLSHNEVMVEMGLDIDALVNNNQP